jgi:flagellar FliL protein
MADEDADNEVKKKSPIVKVIVLVVLVLVLLGGAVFGTLLATGFFDEKPAPVAAEVNGEAALNEAQDGAAAAEARRAANEPPRVTRKAPERTRFEFNYHEVEREFLANLTQSRKVMQIQLALMTRYDKRVFDNFRKHEFALRSVTLDVMRQTQEADIAKPDFRVRLAEQIREAINAKLEEFEDFGGIEEVFFTTFVIQ